MALFRQALENGNRMCLCGILAAHAIYAAINGAQLAARSRGDIATYDSIIAGYRASGLIPT